MLAAHTDMQLIFMSTVDFSPQSDVVRGRHESLASRDFADRGDRAVECRPDKVESCRGHGNDADMVCAQFHALL